MRIFGSTGSFPEPYLGEDLLLADEGRAKFLIGRVS